MKAWNVKERSSRLLVDEATSNGMSSPVPIRDVETDATTNREIGEFIRRSDRAVDETIEAQRRVRGKWNTEKDLLRAWATYDSDRREREQLAQLANLVNYAFVSIPFYRELYGAAGFRLGDIASWADFAGLPVTNKKMLVDAGVGEQAIQNLPRNRIHSARTSGSSGLNLTIFQDDESVEFRQLRYLRHCEFMLGAEMRPTDWRYGIYFAAERFTSLLGEYPFVTVSQDCPPELVVKHLSEVRPRLLLSFPSYLQRLAESGTSLAAFGIEAVGTNSERSTTEERGRYADIFEVPVLDEYSSEEMSLIAHECRHGRYHLVEDSGYFEVADPDALGFGRLVGTSFGNRFMPFIRYDQGDVLKIDTTASTCGCGSTFRAIDSFRGREDESLLDGGTRTIGADAVLGICDRTLVEVGSNVLQYQITQIRDDRIELRLAPLSAALSVRNSLVSMFVEELKALFVNVDMRVDIVETATFEPYPSGKRRLIHVDPSLKGKQRV